MFEIGNSLREARERQRLGVAEVEQAIKVRAKYVRALEDEEFDTLLGHTYIKGFLRAYADYLGLDGQLYVDEYNSRFVAEGDDHHNQLRPRQSSVRTRQHRRLETHVVIAALTLIVAVTVLVFAAWRFGGTSKEPTSVANLTPKPAKAHAARSRARHRVVAPAARKPVRTTVQLVARATRGNCWLEVHSGSATGRLLFQGTLEQGQRQRFTGRRIWMNVGVPENLELRLDGHPVALARTGTPQVVLVTRSGIAPAPSA